MLRRFLLTMAALMLVFGATACPSGGSDGEGGGEILSQVVDNDSLRCGVRDDLPGFAFLEGDDYAGFDVEFCRVIAAAVLGDADKVEFVSIPTEQRFTALQGGEIDVLSRNTTWTSSRDGAEGASFVKTTFYDGQGMMVAADSAYRSLEDMDGATICLAAGTTTELNLASRFGALGIDFEPLSFPDIDTVQNNFIEGRCDGWTSDKSQLAGVRSNWPGDEGGSEGLRILDETMSKEPLGPLVRDGDTDWFDVVNWAVLATIQAEEFEITSANVDQIVEETDDPDITRFLGRPVEADEGEAAVFNPGLGLPEDFAYQVVKQVGNYEEIYNRNVGPETALGLERGPNALWSQGGLHYAPPYR
ncbi:MAG: amino acid ABC transporter substrate-binding protein [Actinomycetota bacterium]